MVRIQLSITLKQKLQLIAQSKESGLSMADIVRRMIDDAKKREEKI